MSFWPKDVQNTRFGAPSLAFGVSITTEVGLWLDFCGTEIAASVERGPNLKLLQLGRLREASGMG
jgi:hypothetical protein